MVMGVKTLFTLRSKSQDDWRVAVLGKVPFKLCGEGPAAPELTAEEKKLETAFRHQICLNCFGEHALQVALGVYAMVGLSGTMDEFIAFSLISAAMQTITISLQQWKIGK